MQNNNFDELMVKLVNDIGANLPWFIEEVTLRRQEVIQYRELIDAYWSDVKEQIDALFEGCKALRMNNAKKYLDVYFDKEMNANRFAEELIKGNKRFNRYEVEKHIGIKDVYHIARFYS